MKKTPYYIQLANDGSFYCNLPKDITILPVRWEELNAECLNHTQGWSVNFSITPETYKKLCDEHRVFYMNPDGLTEWTKHIENLKCRFILVEWRKVPVPFVLLIDTLTRDGKTEYFLKRPRPKNRKLGYILKQAYFWGKQIFSRTSDAISDMSMENIIPTRKVPVYDNWNDFYEVENKKLLENNKKRQEKIEAKKDIVLEPWNFKSPTFEVVDIKVPTETVKLNVGDKVRYEIVAFYKTDEGNVRSSLQGSMGYSNYIKMFVNNEFRCSLTFPDLRRIFNNNFQFKQV